MELSKKFNISKIKKILGISHQLIGHDTFNVVINLHSARTGTEKLKFIPLRLENRNKNKKAA